MGAYSDYRERDCKSGFVAVRVRQPSGLVQLTTGHEDLGDIADAVLSDEDIDWVIGQLNALREARPPRRRWDIAFPPPG